jgi:hypothetical protein
VALAVALAAGVLAALAMPAFAASLTYYVSPTGSGGACSGASPCLLATALSDAALASDSGDAVTIDLAAGTDYSPITINGGSESSLTLDGTGASAVNGGGSQATVSISVSVPITLDHLGITGGHASDGGGIDISNGGADVAIEDSTITGNSASSAGGGVYAEGTVDVYGSTIADNTGGGIERAAGTVELGADVLAINGGDCAGTITDAGYNYADDGTCPATSGTSLDNAGSLDLGPLSPSTETLAVSSLSEAYDVVPTSTTFSGEAAPFCSGADQRGVARTQGSASACSAGAYQYAPPVITGLSSPALELGLPLTISGVGFANLTAASLGATPATITSQTNTALTIALPLSLPLGSQPITLTNPDGSANAAFSAVGSPDVATLRLPPGEHGVPYSEAVPVSGGRAPFSFATASGALPRGLSLSSAGVISGTPTSTGGSAFGVVVTDANGVVAASQTVSLTIAVPVISIKSKTAKIIHNELPVVLGCTFAPCAGTVTLTGSVTTKVKGHEKTTSVTLASAKYATLAPGTGLELELLLTAKGHKTLAHVAKHHLHEVVIASVDAGQTIASSVAVF